MGREECWAAEGRLPCRWIEGRRHKGWGLSLEATPGLVAGDVLGLGYGDWRGPARLPEELTAGVGAVVHHDWWACE